MRFWQKTTPFNFWSIDELEEVLTLFYEKYNNERLHSSVCNLPQISFRMLEQRTNRTKQRNKMEDKIQTQDTL
jgi:hypothetical protein